MPARFAAALLSGAALFATALPAFAIEPEAAADALAAALTGDSSAEADYDAARQDGSNIVITGLSVSHGGDDAGGDSVSFAETVIESPTEGDQGVFDSPRISFNNGTISGESKGTIGNATLTDVTVLDPEEAEGDGPGQAVLFHTAEATGLKVALKDQPGEVSVGHIFMETGDIVDNLPLSSKGSVEDIAVPAEAFADSQFTPQTIGYENLVLGLTWDGSRDPAAKTLDLRDVTLSIKDGGDLKISGKFGNLPEPTALNDADAAAKAAAAEVHTVTVQYVDKSLAGRILDMLAQQQGISREEYAKQIAGA
ncbi:MAG TPA: hypothetical protein VN240_01300, partial [Propylenella sp.]|nr:hypothetical protein [Propylenella sp.]